MWRSPQEQQSTTIWFSTPVTSLSSTPTLRVHVHASGVHLKAVRQHQALPAAPNRMQLRPPHEPHHHHQPIRVDLPLAVAAAAAAAPLPPATPLRPAVPALPLALLLLLTNFVRRASHPQRINEGSHRWESTWGRGSSVAPLLAVRTQSMGVAILRIALIGECRRRTTTEMWFKVAATIPRGLHASMRTSTISTNTEACQRSWSMPPSSPYWVLLRRSLS